jgi:hypothetical protein
MKKLAFVILAVGLITSCSKDEPNHAGSTTSPTEVKQLDYITKIVELDKTSRRPNAEMNFVYDNQKRLVSFTETLPFTRPVQTYEGTLTYTANEVLLRYNKNKYQANLVKPSEYRLKLNAKGKAIELEEKHFFNTGTDDIDEDDYVYDRDGHVTSYDSPVYNSVALTWLNGNLMKSVFESGSTVTVNHEYNTYENRTYPDLNLFLYGLSASPVWKYLWSDQLGLRSKNLLSGTKRESSSPAIENYVYTFDSKGRPSEIEVVRTDGYSTILLITYAEN